MPTDSAHTPQAGTAPPLADVPLDHAGRVATSLPCRTCGYDLNGVHASGVCPECGGAVARSIRGDLLKFRDPAWLERLRRGAMLLVIAIVGGVVTQLGITGGAIIAGILQTLTGLRGAMNLVLVAGGLVSAIVLLFTVAGAWLFTTQDPGRSETEPQISPRSVARLAIMATLISSPLQMVMGQRGTFTGGGTSGFGAADVVLMIFAGGSAVIALVGWVAFYIYLRRIMLQVPLARLALQVRIVMWGYAISTIVTVLFNFSSMILVATGRIVPGSTSMSSTMQVTAIGVSLGTCGGMLVFMIFELWAGLLLLRLWKRLGTMTGEQDAAPAAP